MRSQNVAGGDPLPCGNVGGTFSLNEYDADRVELARGVRILSRREKWRLILAATVVIQLGTGLFASDQTKESDETEPSDRLELLERFHTELVDITPGSDEFPATFTMGATEGPASEQPARMVTLTGPFAMSRYEVPQNLYEAVAGKNPSAWKGPRNSVEMISWQEAVLFCRQATQLMRQAKLIGRDEEIRLPSEAEWEYCCRAGTTTRYSFGESATTLDDRENQASLLDSYAWHTGNAAGNDPPVGAKMPNAWGLYDMHGYLWEFVADHWHDNYQKASSESGPWEEQESGALRVIRGGSWRDRYVLLQSSTRWPIPDHARSDAVGFRCVKSKVTDDTKQ